MDFWGVTDYLSGEKENMRFVLGIGDLVNMHIMDLKSIPIMLSNQSNENGQLRHRREAPTTIKTSTPDADSLGSSKYYILC
jgi:hypothetical protein